MQSWELMTITDGSKKDSLEKGQLWWISKDEMMSGQNKIRHSSQREEHACDGDKNF